MVYMVNVQMGGWIYYFTMHLKIESLFCFRASGISACIKGVNAPDGIPFVRTYPVVIVGIDDGVFALCERYSSVRIAAAQPAIEQDERYERLYQPVGNRKRQNNFDCFLHPPR